MTGIRMINTLLIYRFLEDINPKKHLLLLDNNVLASSQFPKIVQDIKKMGFAKGAIYIEPN